MEHGERMKLETAIDDPAAHGGSAVVVKSHDCVLCNSPMRPRFATEEAEYFRCPKCHYLRSFVTDLDTQALNTAIYQERFDENLEIASKISKGGRRRYARILDRAAPFQERGEFLDIGCGAGRLLLCASERGWNAVGCDPSMQRASKLTRQGMRIHPKLLHECAFEDGRFDVVHANELIEHLEDPVPLLSEAVRVLRPGGLLILRTPNYESWTARLVGAKWRGYGVFENGHVGFFAPRSFETLFDRLGLDLLRVETHHFSLRDRFRIDVPVLGALVRLLYRGVGQLAHLAKKGDRLTAIAKKRGPETDTRHKD